MNELSSPFKTILNFRDVGDYINKSTGDDTLVTGRIYRSARPDEASKEDRSTLVQKYKVKSIIDLRSKTEHILQAQQRDQRIRSSSLASQSNDDVAEPLKIDGIDYFEIDFNGSAFTRHLVSKLSWFEFAQLIGLMALGYRTSAISIVTAKAMAPRGLVGLGIDSIEMCMQEILQVFTILSEQANYPVMVHCTQGKDRTGLVIIVLLLLLEAPIDAIQGDYMRSDPELLPEKDSRMAEISAIGLGEEFAFCAPGMVNALKDHIREKYGGVENYLMQAGVTRDMQDNIRSNLLHTRLTVK